MDKVVRLNYGGKILRTCSGSVEFDGMSDEVLFFPSRFPTMAELIDRVKDRLGWTAESVVVKVEGRIDVGSSNGPRIQMMAGIGYESEWETYKEVVMASEVRVLDIVVRKEEMDSVPIPFDLHDSPITDYNFDFTMPTQQSMEEVANEEEGSGFNGGIIEDVPHVVPQSQHQPKSMHRLP
ncbi:hypothetical protein ACP4OV_020200 [Aristida adscensionis]